MDSLSQVAAKAAVIACGSLVALLSALHCTRLPAQEKSAQAPLSLSLRDAIRTALGPQGDPEIGVAAESEVIAEGRFRDARGLSMPQIDASVTGINQILNLAVGGLGEVHFPIPNFSFPNSVGPFNTLDAHVHVLQGIFDREASWQARALHAGVMTAKDQTDEVRDQIATNVAKLYLAAVNASGAINLAKARVDSAEATLRELTDRSAEGKALPIDVSHARVRVESEQQFLIQAQMDRARAELDLLNALNLPLDTPLNLTDALTFTPQDTTPPAEAVAIALKSRAEIMTQKQRLESDRLNNNSIQAERLPTVSAFATGGSQGTTIPNSIGTYNVGIALNVPIFDGGRRASRGVQTVAAVRQGELRQRELEKQVELEVRQALLKLDATKARADVTLKEFAIAQEELDHRRRLSEQGIGQESVVADAQLALAQADEARLAALYAWNEARIELMQAMGTIRSLAQ